MADGTAQARREAAGAVAGPAGGPAGDPRYRFLARFGATILSGGIAAIPMAIYHYQAQLGLAPQEVWFVGYILAHRWTAALPYPSLRQMSRRTGISTQMLHRYKQSLIEKGYLETISRHRPSGGRTSNFYDFSGLFHALEQCLVRDRRDGQWQPTADEMDGPDQPDSYHNSVAGPGVNADPEPLLAPGPIALPAPTPARRAALSRPSVPASQHLQRSDALVSRQEGAKGRQLGLAGERQRTWTGAQPLPLATAGEAAFPWSGDPAAPQESRVIGHKNEGRGRSPLDSEGSTRPEPQVTTERALRNAPNVPATLPAPERNDRRDGEPQQRWRFATQALAGQISEAALHSWILPLQPVVPCAGGQERSGAGDNELPIALACPTVFHREQVLRRYRALIEAALGSPVHLVVQPDPSAT